MRVISIDISHFVNYDRFFSYVNKCFSFCVAEVFVFV